MNYTASAIAAMIRRDLKNAYPELTQKSKGGRANYFSVTSKNGFLRISWSDYPTTEDIRDITEKYVTKRFDGMQDMWVYEKKTLNGVEFNGISAPTLSYNISPERMAIIKQVAKDRGMEEDDLRGRNLDTINNSLGYIRDYSTYTYEKPTYKNYATYIQLWVEKIIYMNYEKKQPIFEQMRKSSNVMQNYEKLTELYYAVVLYQLFKQFPDAPSFGNHVFRDAMREGIPIHEEKAFAQFLINTVYPSYINSLSNIQRIFTASYKSTPYANVTKPIVAHILSNDLSILSNLYLDVYTKFGIATDDVVLLNIYQKSTEVRNFIQEKMEGITEQIASENDIVANGSVRAKQYRETMHKNIKENLSFGEGDYESEAPLALLIQNLIYNSPPMANLVLVNAVAIKKYSANQLVYKEDTEGVVKETIEKMGITVSSTEPLFRLIQKQYGNLPISELEYLARRTSPTEIEDYYYQLQLIIPQIFEALEKQIGEENLKQALSSTGETTNGEEKDENTLPMLKQKYQQVFARAFSIEKASNVFEKKLNQQYVKKIVEAVGTPSFNAKYEIVEEKSDTTTSYVITYNEALEMYQFDSLFIRFLFSKSKVHILYLVSTTKKNHPAASRKDIRTTTLVNSADHMMSLFAFHSTRNYKLQSYKTERAEGTRKRFQRLHQVFGTTDYIDLSTLSLKVVALPDNTIYLTSTSNSPQAVDYLVTDTQIACVRKTETGSLAYYAILYSSNFGEELQMQQKYLNQLDDTDKKRFRVIYAHARMATDLRKRLK